MKHHPAEAPAQVSAQRPASQVLRATPGAVTAPEVVTVHAQITVATPAVVVLRPVPADAARTAPDAPENAAERVEATVPTPVRAVPVSAVATAVPLVEVTASPTVDSPAWEAVIVVAGVDAVKDAPATAVTSVCPVAERDATQTAQVTVTVDVQDAPAVAEALASGSVPTDASPRAVVPAETTAETTAVVPVGLDAQVDVPDAQAPVRPRATTPVNPDAARTAEVDVTQSVTLPAVVPARPDAEEAVPVVRPDAAEAVLITALRPATAVALLSAMVLL